MIDMAEVWPTDADADFIVWITDRCQEEERPEHRRMWSDYIWDLQVAHYLIPMDLPKLLACDSADFWYDIDGISANLDREAGTMSKIWQPRSSVEMF